MAKDINDILQSMRAAGKVRDNKGKGNFGEDAVFSIIHNYCIQRGGFIERGYMYPYATNKAGVTYLGNIFLGEDGIYSHNSRKVNDEIDILYVSPFRIFPIEVKSYHANMVLKDEALYQNKVISYHATQGHKNPIWQTEKHARHLYHSLYEVLPDGNPKYIQPILCFCDRCDFTDERSMEMQQYIPATVLNSLKEVLMDFDTPLEYRLDIDMVMKVLKERRSSSCL